MGKSKTTTETSSTSTATPTAMETQLNQMQMGALGSDNAYGNAINKLLLGQQLGGEYNSIYGINDAMAQNMAGYAAGRTNPAAQAAGILDSGTQASVYGRTYGDILRGVAQFNSTQQQGALGMGMGGQQGMMAGMSDLGNRLAGLRTTTGTQQGTQKNPFITGADIMGGVGMAVGTMFNPYSALLKPKAPLTEGVK